MLRYLLNIFVFSSSYEPLVSEGSTVGELCLYIFFVLYFS